MGYAPRSIDLHVDAASDTTQGADSFTTDKHSSRTQSVVSRQDSGTFFLVRVAYAV